MHSTPKAYDVIIIGAGIFGLTLAYELKKRFFSLSILILEKESHLGAHASGRNSGVLHAGIYYPKGSLKAKFCKSGREQMTEFCHEHEIPVFNCGKIIVATKPSDQPQLDLIKDRADENQVPVEVLSEKDLKELEPLAFTHERFLYSPTTSVVDPKPVLETLESVLNQKGVQIKKGEEVLIVNPHEKTLLTQSGTYSYGHLVNAAGSFSDKIAHQMGVGLDYRLIPFKGIYALLNPEFSQKIRHCVYPVPDLRYPFLGVHLTLTPNRSVKVGPTAIPAFGRENYEKLTGFSARDIWTAMRPLMGGYFKNQDGLRNLIHEELKNYYFPHYVKSAQKLIPSLQAADFKSRFYKSGIRAQLVDLKKQKLLMDFKIEKGPDSTHLLNAVSPGWTSSFAFAQYLVDEFLLLN